MNVNAKDSIAGIPVLKVRKLMRRRDFNELEAAHFLEVSPPLRVYEVLDRLIDEGYAEWVGHHAFEHGPYRASDQGLRLANASAAKPITRATVERKLNEFLERVRVANSRKEFLFGVRRAWVFGSYLSDKERLSDLDLNLEMVCKIPKGKFGQYRELMKERVRAAIIAGRTFSNSSQQSMWPETEVLLFLKNRSHVYSFHRYYEDELPLYPAGKLIYEDLSWAPSNPDISIVRS
jgi:hypothetical protein